MAMVRREFAGPHYVMVVGLGASAQRLGRQFEDAAALHGVRLRGGQQVDETVIPDDAIAGAITNDGETDEAMGDTADEAAADEAAADEDIAPEPSPA